MRKVVWAIDHRGMLYEDAQPLLATKNVDLFVMGPDVGETNVLEHTRQAHAQFGEPDLIIFAESLQSLVNTVVPSLGQHPRIWISMPEAMETHAGHSHKYFTNVENFIDQLTNFFDAVPPMVRPKIIRDEQTSSISLSGQTIKLTPREFDIFNQLLFAPDCCLPRQELQQRVWNGLKVCNKVLDVHVSNLRKKIHRHGVTVRFVKPGSFELAFPSNETNQGWQQPTRSA